MTVHVIALVIDQLGVARSAPPEVAVAFRQHPVRGGDQNAIGAGRTGEERIQRVGKRSWRSGAVSTASPIGQDCPACGKLTGDRLRIEPGRDAGAQQVLP